MSSTNSANSAVRQGSDNKKIIGFILLFILIAAAGLAYVKWWPYYHKAIAAATDHSIGSSILTGGQHDIPAPSWQTAWSYAAAYYKSVWKAALLGILLGTLVQVLLPSRWLLDALGKMSFKSTALGGLASLPAMMCTCCAAPIAVGLRKKNVSVGASLAFWLGNPTLNPATLIFMTFVLSWKFTLIRLVFGLLLTFGISYLADRFGGDRPLPDRPAKLPEPPAPESGPFLVRWLKSIWAMLLYIVPAYVIAVLLLGAFRAWMFAAPGDGTLFDSDLAIILFAIAGTLFVIPTAAEIPIIQAFLDLGIGPGPAAALLLTLPAISLPSVLMVYRSFPRRVMGMVIASVAVVGIFSGLTGALLL